MMKACIFHENRIYFEDAKAALKKEKIVDSKCLSYLPMAVCSCRRKVQSLPFSDKELYQIIQYFIHNSDTEIKSEELKAVLRSICSANNSTLDKSYFKLIYIIYYAMKKDFSLLMAERKHVPEESEQEPDTSELEEEYPVKLTKEDALYILAKRRSKMPIDREVMLPMFPGNMKHLCEVTGKHFSNFSKKNGCLVFSNTSPGSRRSYRRPAMDVKTSVNICCKSEEEFVRTSAELSSIAKDVQAQRERRWCQKRGIDYGVWKSLHCNEGFKFDEEEWEPLNAVIASRPEDPSVLHSNKPIKGHVQSFMHLQVPEKAEEISKQRVKSKMPAKPINIRNGRIVGQNRFEDRIRRERERRKTFCESFQTRKGNRSSKSYTEESFTSDFKSFVTDRYEKKLIRDKRTGGKKEHVAAQALQGGHCLNCVKPFESLKAEPNGKNCVFHPGFIDGAVAGSQHPSTKVYMNNTLIQGVAKHAIIGVRIEKPTGRKNVITEKHASVKTQHSFKIPIGLNKPGQKERLELVSRE